jgi:hypothetical protein
METKARREPATSGQAITGAQSSALDVGRERTRNLQEGRQGGAAVEIDHKLPGPGHREQPYSTARSGQLVQVKFAMWALLLRPGCRIQY